MSASGPSGYLVFFYASPFKMHKIIKKFPPKKIIKKKYVCLPDLKFSDLIPKHTYFLFGLIEKI